MGAGARGKAIAGGGWGTVANASLTRGSSLVAQQNSLWLKTAPLHMPAHSDVHGALAGRA
jgi:hypothetical protein